MEETGEKIKKFLGTMKITAQCIRTSGIQPEHPYEGKVQLEAPTPEACTLDAKTNPSGEEEITKTWTENNEAENKRIPQRVNKKEFLKKVLLENEQKTLS